jgi:Tat protein secretion system quality control protein TatD with DNase activity
VRKFKNEPAFVAHTLEFLADLRGVAHSELGEVVEGTAAHVFSW